MEGGVTGASPLSKARLSFYLLFITNVDRWLLLLLTSVPSPCDELDFGRKQVDTYFFSVICWDSES